MKILVQNQGSLPYVLEFDTDNGDVVRELLAPKGCDGDTVDLGERTEPYELNKSKYVRDLVNMTLGSDTVFTTTVLGYIVSKIGGQITIEFQAEYDDIVPVPGVGGGGSLPTPTGIGNVLFSTDGLSFVAAQPLTGPSGWLVNDEGLLLVVG